MSTLALNPLDFNPNVIREQLHLSRERMGRVLRVSSKTVERWERRQAVPDARARKDFSQLKQIAELAHSVYTPDGVKALLTTPLQAFDGRTALDLMNLGEYERVIAALAADYEGLGY